MHFIIFVFFQDAALADISGLCIVSGWRQGPTWTEMWTAI